MVVLSALLGLGSIPNLLFHVASTAPLVSATGSSLTGGSIFRTDKSPSVTGLAAIPSTVLASLPSSKHKKDRQLLSHGKNTKETEEAPRSTETNNLRSELQSQSNVTVTDSVRTSSPLRDCDTEQKNSCDADTVLPKATSTTSALTEPPSALTEWRSNIPSTTSALTEPPSALTEWRCNIRDTSALTEWRSNIRDPGYSLISISNRERWIRTLARPHSSPDIRNKNATNWNPWVKKVSLVTGNACITGCNQRKTEKAGSMPNAVFRGVVPLVLCEWMLSVGNDVLDSSHVLDSSNEIPEDDSKTCGATANPNRTDTQSNSIQTGKSAELPNDKPLVPQTPLTAIPPHKNPRPPLPPDVVKKIMNQAVTSTIKEDRDIFIADFKEAVRIKYARGFDSLQGGRQRGRPVVEKPHEKPYLSDLMFTTMRLTWQENIIATYPISAWIQLFTEHLVTGAADEELEGDHDKEKMESSGKPKETKPEETRISLSMAGQERSDAEKEKEKEKEKEAKILKKSQSKARILSTLEVMEAEETENNHIFVTMSVLDQNLTEHEDVDFEHFERSNRINNVENSNAAENNNWIKYVCATFFQNNSVARIGQLKIRICSKVRKNWASEKGTVVRNDSQIVEGGNKRESRSSAGKNRSSSREIAGSSFGGGSSSSSGEGGLSSGNETKSEEASGLGSGEDVSGEAEPEENESEGAPNGAPPNDSESSPSDENTSPSDENIWPDIFVTATYTRMEHFINGYTFVKKQTDPIELRLP